MCVVMKKHSNSTLAKYDRSINFGKFCLKKKDPLAQSIWFFQEFENKKIERIKILQGMILSPKIRNLEKLKKGKVLKNKSF